MEALFINKIKYTKDVYIEYNKRYLFTKVMAIRLFVSLFFGIMAFLYYYLYYMSAVSVLLIIFAVIFCFIPEIRIRMFAKNSVKQMLMLYNEISDVKISFFEENIISENLLSKAEATLEYNKIKKVCQSKKLYLLQLDNKLLICVDKNRFEKGNCEEFEKFIKSKAVNAKIKL